MGVEHEGWWRVRVCVERQRNVLALAGNFVTVNVSVFLFVFRISYRVTFVIRYFKNNVSQARKLFQAIRLEDLWPEPKERKERPHPTLTPGWSLTSMCVL